MKRITLLSILLFCLIPILGLSVVELDFWHYWDGTNGEKLEELVDQFNEENPDIQIKPVFIPGSSIVSKIQTAALSGRTPALAISDIIKISLIEEAGQLVDLNPYIMEDNYNIEDFYKELLIYGTKGDELVSLPVSSSNLGLFWNKELFEEAGLDPQTPPKTWEEVVEFGKIIKEKTGKNGHGIVHGWWRRNHMAVAGVSLGSRR